MASLALEKVRYEEGVGRRLALISVTVSAILAAAKLVVGIAADSNAVVSDGLEASGDVLSSAMVFLGLWLARKPPDAEHPYGHGRYETLAGLGVGAMLLLTGAGILWHGLTTLEEENSLRAFAVYPLLAAIVCKLFLGSAKFRVASRIGSSSLQADGWHDVTDLMSTFVALIAVFLTLQNPLRFRMADHFGGIVIGIIIVFLSARIVWRTIESLLDTMPEADKMSELRDVALRVPGARGIEKCFARRTGLQYHVDLHLEVDPEMTVRQSHEIASQVKIVLKETLPWVADVLVHVEPSGMGHG